MAHDPRSYRNSGENEYQDPISREGRPWLNDNNLNTLSNGFYGDVPYYQEPPMAPPMNYGHVATPPIQKEPQLWNEQNDGWGEWPDWDDQDQAVPPMNQEPVSTFTNQHPQNASVLFGGATSDHHAAIQAFQPTAKAESPALFSPTNGPADHEGFQPVTLSAATFFQPAQDQEQPSGFASPAGVEPHASSLEAFQPEPSPIPLDQGVFQQGVVHHDVVDEGVVEDDVAHEDDTCSEDDSSAEHSEDLSSGSEVEEVHAPSAWIEQEGSAVETMQTFQPQAQGLTFALAAQMPTAQDLFTPEVEHPAVEMPHELPVVQHPPFLPHNTVAHHEQVIEAHPMEPEPCKPVMASALFADHSHELESAESGPEQDVPQPSLPYEVVPPSAGHSDQQTSLASVLFSGQGNALSANLFGAGSFQNDAQLVQPEQKLIFSSSAHSSQQTPLASVLFSGQGNAQSANLFGAASFQSDAQLVQPERESIPPSSAHSSQQTPLASVLFSGQGNAQSSSLFDAGSFQSDAQFVQPEQESSALAVHPTPLSSALPAGGHGHTASVFNTGSMQGNAHQPEQGPEWLQSTTHTDPAPVQEVFKWRQEALQFAGSGDRAPPPMASLLFTDKDEEGEPLFSVSRQTASPFASNTQSKEQPTGQSSSSTSLSAHPDQMQPALTPEPEQPPVAGMTSDATEPSEGVPLPIEGEPGAMAKLTESAQLTSSEPGATGQQEESVQLAPLPGLEDHHMFPHHQQSPGPADIAPEEHHMMPAAMSHAEEAHFPLGSQPSQGTASPALSEESPMQPMVPTLTEQQPSPPSMQLVGQPVAAPETQVLHHTVSEVEGVQAAPLMQPAAPAEAQSQLAITDGQHGRLPEALEETGWPVNQHDAAPVPFTEALHTEFPALHSEVVHPSQEHEVPPPSYDGSGIEGHASAAGLAHVGEHSAPVELPPAPQQMARGTVPMVGEPAHPAAPSYAAMASAHPPARVHEPQESPLHQGDLGLVQASAFSVPSVDACSMTTSSILPVETAPPQVQESPPVSSRMVGSLTTDPEEPLAIVSQEDAGLATEVPVPSDMGFPPEPSHNPGPPVGTGMAFQPGPAHNPGLPVDTAPHGAGGWHNPSRLPAEQLPTFPPPATGVTQNPHPPTTGFAAVPSKSSVAGPIDGPGQSHGGDTPMSHSRPTSVDHYAETPSLGHNPGPPSSGPSVPPSGEPQPPPSGPLHASSSTASRSGMPPHATGPQPSSMAAPPSRIPGPRDSVTSSNMPPPQSTGTQPPFGRPPPLGGGPPLSMSASQSSGVQPPLGRPLPPATGPPHTMPPPQPSGTQPPLGRPPAPGSGPPLNMPASQSSGTQPPSGRPLLPGSGPPSSSHPSQSSGTQPPAGRPPQAQMPAQQSGGQHPPSGRPLPPGSGPPSITRAQQANMPAPKSRAQQRPTSSEAKAPLDRAVEKPSTPKGIMKDGYHQKPAAKGNQTTPRGRGGRHSPPPEAGILAKASRQIKAEHPRTPVSMSSLWANTKPCPSPSFLLSPVVAKVMSSDGSPVTPLQNQGRPQGNTSSPVLMTSALTTSSAVSPTPKAMTPVVMPLGHPATPSSGPPPRKPTPDSIPGSGKVAKVTNNRSTDGDLSSDAQPLPVSKGKKSKKEKRSKSKKKGKGVSPPPAEDPKPAPSSASRPNPHPATGHEGVATRMGSTTPLSKPHAEAAAPSYGRDHESYSGSAPQSRQGYRGDLSPEERHRRENYLEGDYQRDYPYHRDPHSDEDRGSRRYRDRDFGELRSRSEDRAGFDYERDRNSPYGWDRSRDPDPYRRSRRDEWESRKSREEWDGRRSRESRPEYTSYSDWPDRRHSREEYYDRTREDYYGRRGSNHLEDYRGYDPYADPRRTNYSGDNSFRPIGQNWSDSGRSNSPSSGRSSPHYQHADPYYGYHGYYGMPQYGYPGYYPHDYAYAHAHAQYYEQWYKYQQAYGGHAGHYGGEGASYLEGQYSQGEFQKSGLELDEQVGEVQEITPSRTTPLHFTRPHVRCCFGVGGQMMVVRPNQPGDGQRPVVEVTQVKVIFSAEDLRQIEEFPGPLSCKDTIRREITDYIHFMAESIQKSAGSPTAQARWVLWKFMSVLIKHNGAVVKNDIAEILMLSVKIFESSKQQKVVNTAPGNESSEESSSDESSDESSSEDSDGAPKPPKPPKAAKPVVPVTPDIPVEPALPDHLLVYRALMLEGQRKEAIQYASNHDLWGHALLTSVLMDHRGSHSLLKSNTSGGAIGSFLKTLEPDDPLNTVYEHLGGVTPKLIRSSQNWASNLAAMVANPSNYSDRDKANITTMGDTLEKDPSLLWVAHLCYILAGLKPSAPGPNAKMVLLGAHVEAEKLDKMPPVESLHLTEILEYARGLQDPDFYFTNLPTFRFLHAKRLLEAGMPRKAFHYLQATGEVLVRNRFSFNKMLLDNVHETSEQVLGQLRGAGEPVDEQSLAWISHLKQVRSGEEPTLPMEPNAQFEDENQDPLANSGASFFSGYEPSTSTPYQPSVPESEEQISGVSELSMDDQPAPQPNLPLPSDTKEPPQQDVPPVSMYQPMEGDVPQQEFYQPQAPEVSQDRFEPYPVQQPAFQPSDQVDNQQFPQATQQEWADKDNQMPPQNSWQQPQGYFDGRMGMDEGETTPTNAVPPDQFYGQPQPRMNRMPSWEEEMTTPTPMQQTEAPQMPHMPPQAAKEPAKKVEESKDKNKSSAKPASQGTGWLTGLGSLISKVIPRGPNEVHLPDDKKKTIYFDKEKNRWVNTDEDEQEQAPPPPPPSDAMMMGLGGGPPPMGPPAGAPPNRDMPPGDMASQAPAMPDNDRPGPGMPPAPAPMPGVPPMGNPSGDLPIPKPAGPPSKFSRKALGRLGRNKYVDVLNPHKGGANPAPAAPAALFPLMPPGGGGGTGGFTGSFFVPSAAPADDANVPNVGSQPDVPSDAVNSVEEPTPTHSRSSSISTNSSISLTSAEVRSYFDGQEQQPAAQVPSGPQFFDPAAFSQAAPHNTSRRGHGRPYPGAGFRGR